MFPFNSKPKKPSEKHPRLVFDAEMSAAIVKARRSGIDPRVLAGQLDDEADALRVQHALNAPLF
jgi:hypothetical protein